jgi:hypothetical protein
MQAVTRNLPTVSDYNLSEPTFVIQKRFIEPFQRLMHRRCRERKIMQARQFVPISSMTQFALSEFSNELYVFWKNFLIG